MPVTNGQTLQERYLIEIRIGDGGSAEVYKATDQRTGRSVAVKVLLPHYLSDAEAKTRAFAEPRSVAKIHSPYIIQYIDVFTEKTKSGDDATCLVMQFLEGRSLHSIGNLEKIDAYRYIFHVASGMAQCHHNKVVHRDLKPANIFIQEASRTAVVVDFGLAKRIHATHSGTHTTAAWVGSPAYMAPEQFNGNCEPAVDIYALGCVFFELLEGKRLFSQSLMSELITQKTQFTPNNLIWNSTIPPQIRNLVGDMLTREPNQRPSMSTIAATLQPYVDNAPIPIPPPLPAPRAKPWGSMLFIAGALAGTTGVIYAIRHPVDPPTTRDASPSDSSSPFASPDAMPPTPTCNEYMAVGNLEHLRVSCNFAEWTSLSLRDTGELTVNDQPCNTITILPEWPCERYVHLITSKSGKEVLDIRQEPYGLLILTARVTDDDECLVMAGTQKKMMHNNQVWPIEVTKKTSFALTLKDQTYSDEAALTQPVDVDVMKTTHVIADCIGTN